MSILHFIYKYIYIYKDRVTERGRRDLIKPFMLQADLDCMIIKSIDFITDDEYNSLQNVLSPLKIVK